ncbi:DUF1186 domain-containing protein [bacterium]|nr:DUF1186 domain-containing protein [bacterium]
MSEMAPSNSPEYPSPLLRLLTLGQPKPAQTRFDCETFGITHEHVPDLIRMLGDGQLNDAPGDSDWVWGPLYAWRALGELRAEPAIAPLLDLLARIDQNDDDWVGEEVPRILAQIGPSALAPAKDYLANPAHGEWARVAAARSLGMIGQNHPETRDACVITLRTQLAAHADQSGTLNAMLVSALLDLKAVEALPDMESAFAADHVDETVVGDFEDVEIELGVKTTRTRARRPNQLTEMRARLRAALGGGLSDDGDFEDALADTFPAAPVKRDRVGRNDPCPCGSGKKYKKCCGKS